MNYPHVAVIIGNYNYGEFVCDAILSAVNQDYPNKSVVVVDDNSTDDSVQNIIDLLEKNGGYCEKTGGILYKTDGHGYINDVIVKLIACKINAKQGSSRNIAIQRAWDRADYFAILDSDDEMYVNKLTKCIERFNEHPGLIGSVHTDYLIDNQIEGFQVEQRNPPYSKQLLMKECHLHSGGVIAKYALDKVGLFDEECTPKEDFLQWLKISDFYICVNIPEVLTKVRVTGKNSTVSNSKEFHEKQYELMARKYNEFRSRMGQNG